MRYTIYLLYRTAALSCVYVVRVSSADGQTTLTATIPDTITSWVLSAFAINSDVGLGVAAERAEVVIEYVLHT